MISRRLVSVGEVFGQWVSEGSGLNKVVCVCSCGTTRLVSVASLIRGCSKSCGCSRVKSMSRLMTKHGLYETAGFKVWHAMRRRCNNPAAPDYARYGGAGVSVDPEWDKDIHAFIRDMGQPEPGQTLDRIDNAKGYSKSNCRWATRKEQARNRTTNRLLIHEGEELTVAEWAERIGCDRSVLRSRLESGWSIAEAITRPIRPKRKST